MQRGEKHTCYTDDELLGGDPCAHAEEDLVPGVKVVECAAEGDDGKEGGGGDGRVELGWGRMAARVEVALAKRVYGRWKGDCNRVWEGLVLKVVGAEKGTDHRRRERQRPYLQQDRVEGRHESFGGGH